MQLAIIRHLPTAWNKAGLLQGSKDIEIDVVSLEDKAKINENKASIINYQPYDFILTSSLIRTKQTAKVYGYSNVIQEPLLNELNFGVYEGKEKSLLIKENEDLWVNAPTSLTLGEPLVALEERIKQFVTKYKDCPKVLAFGHGSWIRAAISIQKTGSIALMNKVVVKNNDFILLEFD
ncbi:phosphoglycerate mutase family protein [Cytobacillus suaedae]|nr:phosphoglycerate mutase family protein [Cytobacillus suaedae]